MDNRKWAEVPLDVLQELEKAAQEFMDGRTAHDMARLVRLAHSIGCLSFYLRQAEAQSKEAA